MDRDTVVAVLGVGSLFGFVHLSGVISDLEEAIRGRLLVFFPGEYERSVYRFHGRSRWVQLHGGADHVQRGFADMKNYEVYSNDPRQIRSAKQRRFQGR